MKRRSVQETIDQADDLDRRFETYEPQLGDELEVAEYLTKRAANINKRSGSGADQPE